MEIPYKSRLAVQVAEALRKAILEGEWKGFLPGDRALSVRLQVSRPTLQKALYLLHRESVVCVTAGARTRILISPGPKSKRREKMVRFLSSHPLHNLSYLSLYLIGAMEQRLADAGYRLEIHDGVRISEKNPDRQLSMLAARNPADCWVLNVPSMATYRWFLDRGIPALSMKATPADISLPAIHPHHEAVSRHAAGQCLRLGHRKVALLLGGNDLVGDRMIEKGFHDGMTGGTNSPEAVVAYCDGGSATGIERAAAALFRLKPAPTAVLVPDIAAVILLFSWFSMKNIRIPGDVSVLALNDAPLLPYFRPSIARYVLNPESYARRLVRLVLRISASGSMPALRIQMMPQFLPGDSLTAPKKILSPA
jgi:DNA-binding LacI/PurR family transcriptional regulator